LLSLHDRVTGRCGASDDADALSLELVEDTARLVPETLRVPLRAELGGTSAAFPACGDGDGEVGVESSLSSLSPWIARYSLRVMAEHTALRTVPKPSKASSVAGRLGMFCNHSPMLA
jgi:hypothetical protein